MTSSFTGGCECGNIKYAFTSEPVHTSLCYCTDCARSTGATHTLSHLIPSASFTTTATATASHQPAKAYSRKTDSGATARNHFCPLCGTTMWCVSDLGAERGGIMAIRGGTLDDLSLNERWRPATELFCRNKYGWFPFVVEGAKACEGMPGEEDVRAVAAEKEAREAREAKGA